MSRERELQKEIEHYKNKIDKGIMVHSGDLFRWELTLISLNNELKGLLDERKRIIEIIDNDLHLNNRSRKNIIKDLKDKILEVEK